MERVKILHLKEWNHSPPQPTRKDDEGLEMDYKPKDKKFTDETGDEEHSRLAETQNLDMTDQLVSRDSNPDINLEPATNMEEEVNPRVHTIQVHQQHSESKRGNKEKSKDQSKNFI